MAEIAVPKNESKANKFEKFDMVVDDTDHLYQGNKAGSSFGSGKVAKKIMQEWNILEENLPDTIFVRVYEGRIDLLRAVIVGPAGTPYHNGLFFFDFCFPADYPASPPKVAYRSHGLRLNPNLYESGKVCLSLLNTWYGNNKEKWNPNQSTILQILLSLQGLVLNEKPFFNEPAYKKQTTNSHYLKKSLAYNENIFLLSLRIMTYAMLKPPKHFEELVTAHFRQNGSAILTACKAYMDGRARVGELAGNGSSRTTSVSSKFKTSMDVIYPKLLMLLAKIEASVESFEQQLKEERLCDPAVIAKPMIVKKKIGFAKNIFKVVRKLLKSSKKQNASKSVS